MSALRYVVILELDNGYMDCIHVCYRKSEAYGAAYLVLTDGMDSDGYYVSLAENREGDNGVIIELKDKDDDKVIQWVTILTYKPEDEE
jgi:hypothetical protein